MARVSVMRHSLYEQYLFLSVLETSSVDTVGRSLTGAPHFLQDTKPVVDKELQADDYSFSMLLAQVSVDAADILRTLEVFDN